MKKKKKGLGGRKAALVRQKRKVKKSRWGGNFQLEKDVLQKSGSSERKKGAERDLGGKEGGKCQKKTTGNASSGVLDLLEVTAKEMPRRRIKKTLRGGNRKQM